MVSGSYVASEYNFLTHYGRADISLKYILNAYTWKKLYEFQFIFHWSLFLRAALTIFRRKCIDTYMRQRVI